MLSAAPVSATVVSGDPLVVPAAVVTAAVYYYTLNVAQGGR